MKAVRYLILAFFVCLFFMVCFSLYKERVYGTWSSYWNSSPTDCNLKLPPNIKVAYSVKENRYAIKLFKEYDTVFLWGRTKDWIDDSHSVYTDFADSCTAKSFAKQYLKEQREYEEKKQYH